MQGSTGSKRIDPLRYQHQSWTDTCKMLGWHRSRSRTGLAMLSALRSLIRSVWDGGCSRCSHTTRSGCHLARLGVVCIAFVDVVAQKHRRWSSPLSPSHHNMPSTEIETQAHELSDRHERSNLEGEQGDERGGVSVDAAWARGDVRHGHVSPVAPCWGLARAHGGVCTLSHPPFWLHVQVRACVRKLRTWRG